jgi:hypothetical protein
MRSMGAGIGNILTKFRKRIFNNMQDGLAYETYRGLKDLDGCMWASSSYPELLKTLSEHPHFKEGDNGEGRADAYICGYYRGIRDALYMLEKRMRDREYRGNRQNGLKAA